MNEDRIQRIKELQRSKTAKNTVIVTSEDPFVEALDKKIEQLKEIQGEGIEVNNLETLIENIEKLNDLHDDFTKLKEVVAAIKEIEIPKEVHVQGMKQLIEVMQKIPTETKIVNKINNTNVMDEYQVANSDTIDPSNRYYGFVHPTGKWYILWISGSENTIAYKYATGPSAYSQNWGQRKTQEYKRFDQINL